MSAVQTLSRWQAGYLAYCRVHNVDAEAYATLSAVAVDRWIDAQECAYRQECPDASFAAWLADRWPVQEVAP